jgi:hypothetical protein
MNKFNILQAIGSFFVYRSPNPGEGYERFLLSLPSRKLRFLAGTKTHYSKKTLVKMFLSQK